MSSSDYSLRIGGWNKSSLIDFPGKVSSIIFTQGCNLRCGYCHNPELVLPDLFDEPIPPERVISFLETRQGLLDGLVITGGEPLMQSGLKSFIEQVRALGFLVKLDTNGLLSDQLEVLLDEGLLDYVAMDLKAPLDKYEEVTRVSVPVDNIRKSVNLVMDSGIDYEFRTTVVEGQLGLDDFRSMGELIDGARLWVIQKFVPTEVLDHSFSSAKTFSDAELGRIRQVCEGFAAEVRIR